ncbi:MAG: glycosyltransferase family 4 protein [Candidatus Thorarchaeota archaeon]|nr:glycosyltransferase family 4 protein [Candidatus Thorarchaeota archaeon]
MKLLMISDPSSVHTRNWFEGFTSKGIDVEIIFPKSWIFHEGNVLESIEGRTVLIDVPNLTSLVGHSIKKLALRDLFSDIRNRTRFHQSLCYLGKRIHQYAVEKEIDFIHSHGMATSALLANASGFRPYSVSVWGSDIYLMPKKYPYLKTIIARAAAEAEFIHVESTISEAHLRSLAPNMAKRVLVSTWGVDTDTYRPGRHSSMLKEQLNLDDRKFILSFRSLEPIYRIDLIIKAFEIVAKQDNDLMLVIGGDGSSKEDLMLLSKELGLENRIVFTGFIDSQLKIELFSGALLYVQCPESDGVSLAMMEAMSSGQPLVSSNVGETSILVESGTNGFLIDDENPVDLAEAILSIAKDSELRERLSTMSRTIALEKHSRSAFFESFVDEVQKSISMTKHDKIP